MENQHRRISGYRELTQAEIDLMNKVKALGPQIEAVINEVDGHLRKQSLDAINRPGPDGATECQRLGDATPQRWLSIARTDLQTGLMALTRSVAQPTFF